MKKLLIALLSCAFMSSVFAANWANSDNSAYKKGDMNASIGMSIYYFGFYGTFDYAFHDALSAGGGLGYNGYHYTSYFKYNYFPIVGRVLFHPFNLKVLSDKVTVRDKLDVYVGLSLGWSIGWSKWEGAGVSPSDPDVGGFVIRENIGARFFFKPNFYAFVEEGAGFGWINAGAGLKF
jgi:hypothetical protein